METKEPLLMQIPESSSRRISNMLFRLNAAWAVCFCSRRDPFSKREQPFGPSPENTFVKLNSPLPFHRPNSIAFSFRLLLIMSILFPMDKQLEMFLYPSEQVNSYKDDVKGKGFLLYYQ